jgi:hypothetical protein
MIPNDYEITIHTKKYLGTLSFFFIFLLIWFRLFRYLYDFPHIIPNVFTNIFTKKAVTIISSYYLLFSVLWQARWIIIKVKIRLDSDKIAVTQYVAGIPFTKAYDISKITNMQIKRNEPGGIFGTSDLRYFFTEGKVFRPVDFNPAVLYYNYDRRPVQIGKHLQEWPAQTVLEEIEKRQSKSNFTH